MRKIVAVSLLAVALLLVPPAPSFAWGHGGQGFRGHPGFHGHGVIVIGSSRPPSSIFVSPHHGMRSEDRGPMRSPFRGPHRFVRQPSFAWDTGGGWVDPDDVAVLPQFAEPVPSEAPVPDPKFVYPPTPSASSPTGSHTVIVQRGSQIEVQSFPTTR
jgi:hypothetical protein